VQLTATANLPKTSYPADDAFRLLLAAVIGPPGAGKSTLVADLARIAGVPVFRLRQQVRARPELLAGLAPKPDPLGWISLEAVRRVLHAVFVNGRFAFGSRVVLLDNFPGTAAQLELLAETASRTNARVALLQLHANTPTVVTRVAERRVCLACGPDQHSPAVHADHDPERCAFCGAALVRRETDAPRLHELRLARYLANLPEITECAAEQGIPHLTVDADADLTEVCRAARRALHHLLQSADPSGSRP